MAGRNGSVFNLKGKPAGAGTGSQQKSDALVTVLAEGCSVEGMLICNGPSRLAGDVSGELVADQSLMIDENATVAADINVEEVMVLGAVRGDIKASKRVMLAASATVEGDIETPSITIKDGAQVSGQIAVTRALPPEETSSATIHSMADAAKTAGE